MVNKILKTVRHPSIFISHWSTSNCIIIFVGKMFTNSVYMIDSMLH